MSQQHMQIREALVLLRGRLVATTTLAMFVLLGAEAVL
jgi:hypothetical protein